MKRRHFNIALAAILAATPAFAQETTITVFHAWPHHAEWQQGLADRFMEANPDITVEIQAPSVDYDEGLVTVIRQSLADTAPDVFMVGSHLLGELVARDMVAPLDDVMADVDMGALGYSDAALALTQIDGVQYGLPWTSSTPVMFYNADLVRQAGGDPDDMPTTWDATIDLAQRIDALGDDISGMYYAPGDDDWMVQNLLASAGMQPMDADGTLAFDTKAGRAAFGLWERFHDEGRQQAIPNSAARQQMYAGQLGLYFNSTAAVRSFEREIADRFDWGTSQMPAAVEGGGVASGGMAAVILTDDPARRQAAFEYLLFGTGAEGQDFVVRNTGYMPVNDGAMADDRLGGFYAENPAWRTSAEQMDRAYPWFAWPGQNGVRISQAVVDQLAAIANDQVDTDAAAATLSEEIGRLTR
ncbi:ABC transporter substrate-binding protein [Jannaschia sp. S6380]|uniref:ABC transporter substrate-binding protein n=1 Tax=Jannaschia sp. S6380 TaxID=2926408 RepID=UPI001FF10F36|nr:ABC transporter substrate-binding protein [Jannaschia sp. S6380]MCK0167701.1 ABC transporter substrate-binding protein [Jannaschia sp. S6380]